MLYARRDAGRGKKGAPAQLGAAARGAQAAARSPVRPARVWIGLERRRLDPRPERRTAGSPPIWRRTAAALAYQGVTLSLANFDRLDVRGRVCAVQQSSIFIRVSIARLINERRRIEAVRAASGARAARGPPAPADLRAAASAARRSASATTSSCGSTRCRVSAAFRPRARRKIRRSATRWAPAAF